MVIVLMGVSGVGKTEVGTRLAKALGGRFAEGDDYHPPANVAKMESGVPLDDADRQPWLETMRGEIGRWLDTDQTVVLACSALKASYREILQGGRPGVRFVYLKGSKALIASRLEQRRGHYMPPSLLDSQFGALEEPADAVTVAVDQSPDAIVAAILAALEAQLAHEKKRLNRLVISNHDLNHAKRFAELILNRNSDCEKYLLYALKTALVVAYWRPFSGNKPSPDALSMLEDKHKNAFTPIEKRLHDRIHNVRNQVMAHSDSNAHGVHVFVGELAGSKTAIPTARDPHAAALTNADVQALLVMIEKLTASILEDQMRLQALL